MPHITYSISALACPCVYCALLMRVLLLVVVVVVLVMVMVVVLLDYCIRRTSTNTEEPTR